MTSRKNAYTYKDSGVDIDAGEALVERIKPYAKATARPGADASLGGFGALFDLKAAGFKDPILVLSNDGVGTKLKVAIETGQHETIGIDLVAMCVNDVVVQGAEPLAFLDYYASGRLDVDVAASVIKGIAGACREAGCALSGGETAEMPGLYSKGEYDLAGFVVGAVERGAVLPRLAEMQEGDVLIGLPSSGIHSNGYSLVRKLIEVSGAKYSAVAPFDPQRTLSEALLMPTRIYVTSALAAIRTGGVLGLAHITGGGITNNLPRVIGERLAAEIDLSAWRMPAVFQWLQRTGGVTQEEMLRTFNCGIGLIAIVKPERREDVLKVLRNAGESPIEIGQLVSGAGEPTVRYRGTLS
jgi:phosphoribosylformylglycinamidine cyclo-ligase